MAALDRAANALSRTTCPVHQEAFASPTTFAYHPLFHYWRQRDSSMALSVVIVSSMRRCMCNA
eukprot:scaffold616314_cov48-Prasinocladus_malaysianus.AAC.2